jgi:hypothetical protein
VPIFDLCPTFQEKRDFRFPTDQRRESSWMSNIKATCGSTLAEHLVDVHGLSDATQGLGAQVLAREISLHQAIGGFTDRYRVGCCQSFDTRSNVGHFTQRKLFLTTYAAHGTDNNQTRMNANADSELETFGLL